MPVLLRMLFVACGATLRAAKASSEAWNAASSDGSAAAATAPAPAAAIAALRRDGMVVEERRERDREVPCYREEECESLSAIVD